ncbi:hypothetical protein [Novosphingobium resinovorum]|uniref:hypothetical protein n=1 Tax=Novosphingobium resinovorum TaxID=158500 RepID=UPI0012DD6510|nr:hypothetical protein [Novosphingobium resinovorum]
MRDQTNRLLTILEDMPATAPSRYALSEMVLIRAATVFEEALAAIAYKIACGATFDNGKLDIVLVTSRSLAGARATMLTEGGALASPKQWLKWTRAKFISQSVKGVLAPSSHYVNTCQIFGTQIADLFDARNYAAHKTNTSRTKYKKLVKKQYGHERRIQLGYFLLTKNLSPTSNIEKYIKNVQIIVDQVVAGP